MIEAFAFFERLGAAMSNDEGRNAFINVIVAMRRDSISSANIEPEYLRLVLLGQHPRPI